MSDADTVNHCECASTAEGVSEGKTASAAPVAGIQDCRPFIRLFWPFFDKDGIITDQHAMSTLALVDTGADVTAIVTRAELERLGLWAEVRQLPDNGVSQTSLTPAGGGTIRVLGTIVLQPMLRAQRRVVRSHGNPHFVNVVLPGVAALVVDQPLAGCELIIGERTLQALGASLQREGTRRKLMLRDSSTSVTSVGLVTKDPSSAPHTAGVMATISDFLETTGVAALCEAAAVEQQRLTNQCYAQEPYCLAGLDLSADEPVGTTLDGQQEYVPPVLPSNGQAVDAVTRQVEAAVREARMSVAHDARAQESDAARQRRLADELDAQFRASLASEAEREEQAERQKVRELMKPHLQALLDHMEGVAVSCDSPERRSTPLFGDAVYELNKDEAAKLVDHFNALAASACLDPAMVKRDTNAADMPFRAILQLKPDAVDLPPTREGFARSYSPEKMDAMRAQVTQMLRAGVIEPAGPHCRWAHAAVLVKKTDGSWRFCIDFRPLNRRLETEHYAIPTVDEVCRVLATEGGYYTRYDLKSAFWQVPLDENSRDMTAFYVPRMGLFRFNVLAFGLASATSLFQKNIEHIMAPLLFNGVIVYVDDLIVYGRTKSELLDRMTAVQALFRKFDLRVAPGKCELVSTTIDVLGKRVSEGRIATNPEHVRAVAEWGKPSNVQELRSFLGSASWYRQHLSNFASMTAPLYAMETAVKAKRLAAGTAANAVSKADDRTPLEWTPEAERAFVCVKTALIQPPVLAVPSPNQLDNRLRILSDAHEGTADGKQVGGVGGVLEWLGDDGKWHLVLAHSRALTPAERNYTTTEVELLALVEVMKRSEQYLCKARGVLLCTDHQALVYIETLREHQGGRLGRWAAWLTMFDVKIVYRPGSTNVAADALSRAHSTNAAPSVVSVVSYAGAVQQLAGSNRAALNSDGTVRRESRLCELVRGQLDVVRVRDKNDKFDLIVADPPWAYIHHEKNGGHNRISTRSLCSLPVCDVVGDHAVLLIWATGPKLEDAYEVAHAWGFVPTTVAFVWDRGVANAVPGRYTDARTEMAVVAVKGEGKTRLLSSSHSSGVSQLITAEPPAGRDGERLPQEFWSAVARLFHCGAKRLHLFGRTRQEGWTTVYRGATNTNICGNGTIVAPVNASQVAPVTRTHPARDAESGPDDHVATPPLVPPPPPPVPPAANRPQPATLPQLPPEVSRGGGDDNDDVLIPVPPPPRPDGQVPTAEQAPLRSPLIEDVRQEQDHYDQQCERDKTLLASRSRSVMLQLGENVHTRVLLAKLMKASGLRIDATTDALVEEWCSDENHDTRQLHTTLTRAHALALDEQELSCSELHDALAELQVGGREGVCETWLLRDSASNEFLIGKTFAQLNHRCDDMMRDPEQRDKQTLRVLCIRLDGQEDGDVKWLMPLDATEYRDAVVRRLHASLGHPGVYKTLDALERTGWHIQAKKKCVRAAVLQCLPCSRRKGELKSWHPSVPARPSAHQAIGFNYRLHIDLIGPLESPAGARYVLSMTDAFTRWPEAVIIENKQAETVARCLVNVWICRYGPPAQLTSDRGGEFVAQVIQSTAQAMGTQRLITTPYHPHANGLEERPHRTLNALLALLTQERSVEGADWRHLLPLALFTMRTTVHRMTGHTPMQLVFGCEAALPELLYHAPLLTQHLRNNVVRMASSQADVNADGALVPEAQRRQRFEQADQVANFRTQEVQQVWQRLFDKAVVQEGVRLSRLDPKRSPLAGVEVGDYVRVFDADVMQRDEHTLSPKLEARRWSTPYRVFQVVRGAAVILTLATDPLKHRVETGLRVKRIELPAELKEQYDALFAATQADRARLRRERRHVLEECGWHYNEDVPEEELVYVVEVLRVRGRQGAEEVLVHWSNDHRTWVTMDNVRQLAPEALTRFRQASRQLYEQRPS